MKNAIRKPLWLAALLAALPALAAIPEFWEVRTYDEFRQGELDGLSVSGDGELGLAPRFDLLFDTGDPLVFSAAADSAGNVYLGSGHDGRVHRVEAGGGRLLADLAELDVLAVAVDANDVLYAATSPNGRVYRIGADGAAEVFFDPGARYIWSMVFDREGRLLVATGDEGVIHRVAPDGASEVFYDSDETHIVTLALEADGSVIAGGDPKGYVYRISPEGRAFVLHDAGRREVRAVAVADDGTIYAALLSPGAAPPPAAAPSEPVSGDAGGASVTVTVGAAVEAAQNVVVADGAAGSSAPAGSGSGRIPSASGRGAIIEIRPDGAVTTLWESNTEMVFALLPRPDGLLFSTGGRGRIYRLDPAGQRPPTLLAESGEEQITRLLAHGERLLAATANAGKLFELSDRPGEAGEYLSVVRNTGAISSWGRMVWSGRGAALTTRSGNTASPDSTWSDWAPVGEDGVVGSPPARFVQWKAVLAAPADGTPAGLSSVTLPYLQQNFRPEIRSLDLLQPGVALEAQQVVNPSPPARADGGAISGRITPPAPRLPPRTAVRPGAQALRWTAEDANGDVLEYSIFYRARDEDEWKPLAAGLADPFYTIEPNALPDSIYVFRVIASDIGSNPSERALAGERETRPFAIDSTPPVVTMGAGEIEGRRVRVRIEAEDRTSTLKQAQVSIDAGPWRPVFPVDGIVDSLREGFEFQSPALASGEHVIAFRVYDQNENVGIGNIVVRIP